MSETAKTARNAMKEKAKRLTSADPHTKVDSSTWTPPEAENAGVKTGARPLSKRQFKKGGKVVGKCEGGEAMKRADRKPRKAGGRATSLTPDTLINRDVRMANDVREGTKHVGAFKKGGKTHKADGGATEAQRVGAASSKFYKEGNKPAVQSTKSSDFDAMRNADRNLTTALEQQGYKKGGRAHKFSGGVGQNPVSAQSEQMGKAAGMRKHGGKVHRDDGGPVPVPPRKGDKDYNPYPYRPAAKNPNNPPKQPAYQSGEGYVNQNPEGYKKGGKASRHPDEAEDKKLIKKMVKPKALRSQKAMGGMSDDHDSHANWMKRREETAKEIAAKKAANPGKSF